jgi:hypothetical protein
LDISGTFGDNSGILSGAATPVLDNSIKASGTSSLMFTIPPFSSADTSGSYFTNFSSDLSVQFGENQEFYIQWRQRFSQEFLNTIYQGGGGWKQAIIGTGDKPGTLYSSCTDLETVLHNNLYRGFPQMYNSCTGSTSHVAFAPLEESFGGDFKLQNARPSPFCLYSATNAGTQFPPTGNCFAYFADEWMTFQVRIRTGARSNDEWTGSQVTLWVARENQPSELVIDRLWNLTAGSAAEDQKFGKIWLLPYNTGKSNAENHPTAFTWYDELIISRTKIADVAPAAGAIPQTLGWFQIPNTKLRTVCAAENGFPEVSGIEGCTAITEDWSGGALDTLRNRLLIWGGGHTGYAGNEVYALDLDALTMTRLNNPSTPIQDGCTNNGTYADGRPASRHSYNQLAYLPIQDAMFAWGGSMWQCGNIVRDTWFFNLANDVFSWTKKNDTNGPSGNYARAIAYDPNTSLVYARDEYDLYSYNPATDVWTRRSSASVYVNDDKTAVIDPVRRKYFLHGNNDATLYWYDISSPTASVQIQSGQTTGCSGFIGQYRSGMEYDPVQDRIVGWNGGNTIYILNPDTLTCTTVSHSGGPSALANGTWGRFRYVPSLNLYAVCNSVNEDCYTLRLTP